MKIIVIGFLAACCFASVNCQRIRYEGVRDRTHVFSYEGRPYTVTQRLYDLFRSDPRRAEDEFSRIVQDSEAKLQADLSNRGSYQEPFNGQDGQINFYKDPTNQADDEAKKVNKFSSNKKNPQSSFPGQAFNPPPTFNPNAPFPSQLSLNNGQNQQESFSGPNRPDRREPQQQPQIPNGPSDPFASPSSGYNLPIPDRERGVPDRRDKPVSEFAWRLFKASNSQPNYVLSPISPQILLSYLAWVGNGRTREEIGAATGYGSPKALQKTIDSLLREGEKRELQIATAFFVSKDMKLNDDFLQKSVESADVVPVDFKNPEAASRTISKWANAKTKNGLKLNEINYAPATKVALTSALYYKADWIFKFNPATKGNFYTDKGPVQVDMMTMKKKFRWGQIKDFAEWAAVPYDSGDSLIIILPNKNYTLDQVINRMSETDFIDVLHEFDRDRSNADVNITLPKFKLESTTSLVEPLKAMGIQTLFSPNADLPYLSSYDQVQVSNAEQQASIDVNEEGTVVVSFTNLNVVALSFVPAVPSVTFTVDRPFLAVVANRERNIPYVLAKITNPTY